MELGEKASKSRRFTEYEDLLLISKVAPYEHGLKRGSIKERLEFWERLREEFVRRHLGQRGPPQLQAEKDSPFYKRWLHIRTSYWKVKELILAAAPTTDRQLDTEIERLRQLASSLPKPRQQELTLGLKHFRVIFKEVDGWSGMSAALTNGVETTARAERRHPTAAVEQHESIDNDEEPTLEFRHLRVDERIARLEQHVNALLRAFQHVQHAMATRAISENSPTQLAVELSHTAEQIRLCGQDSPLLEGLQASYRVLKRQLELVSVEGERSAAHCQAAATNKRRRPELDDEADGDQAGNSRQPVEEAES